jgi:hypothetical protein
MMQDQLGRPSSSKPRVVGSSPPGGALSGPREDSKGHGGASVRAAEDRLKSRLPDQAVGANALYPVGTGAPGVQTGLQRATVRA